MFVEEMIRGKYPYVKLTPVPKPCFHCQTAPCQAAHPDTIHTRDDGIVIIDPDVQMDEEIVDSCPWGRIYWNADLRIGQKCTMCAHLLDQGWTEPRCVEACPTDAISFGDLDDPSSHVSKLVASGKAEVLNPELATNPLVSYVDPPKTFVAGTIVDHSMDRLVKEVTVTLTNLLTGEFHAAETNFMGDFEFKGLQAKQPYLLRVDVSGFYPRSRLVYPTTDTYVGDVTLFKKG